MFSLFSAQMDAVFTTGAQELKSMLYGLVIILMLLAYGRGEMTVYKGHSVRIYGRDADTWKIRMAYVN